MAHQVQAVVYDLAVDGGYIAGNGVIRDVEIREGWSKHDIVFVRIEYPRPYDRLYQVFTFPEGAAIRLVWGRRPHDIRTWYGYVNHHEINSQSDSGNTAVEITYVLIGTGRPLNSDRTRVWKNMSYSYAAQRIAREHNLRAIIHKCPNTAVYEVQSGESDFEFLQRLADKSGFNFRVSNSNLYFVNPNILIKERTVVGVPTFTLNKDLTHFDTVGKFQMKAGENIPGRVKARREVFGLDANGNMVRAAAGEGRVTRIDTTEVADSYGEARRIVTGLNLYEQNWTIATATVLGDSRIEPGRLIYLTGNALPDQNEGYWMVEDVIHRVQSALVDPTKDIFTSEMTLSRNSQNTVTVKDQHLLIDGKDIACVLDHSGNWRSTIVTAVIGENA